MRPLIALFLAPPMVAEVRFLPAERLRVLETDRTLPAASNVVSRLEQSGQR